MVLEYVLEYTRFSYYGIDGGTRLPFFGTVALVFLVVSYMMLGLYTRTTIINWYAIQAFYHFIAILVQLVWQAPL
jgi:hypothetical protein